MHPHFKYYTETLHLKYERLMDTPPSQGMLPPHIRGAGVYVFSEGGCHLYVGRTRNVRQRYSQHCRPSSKHNDAPFAFKLARQETGFLKSNYKAGATSRAGLAEDDNFKASFTKALQRIKSMNFRFIEEQDPTKQCLLEIYVSIV